ncbi:hypothetical protein [Anaerosacchariphilus polymeriproducens]|uniref:Uncharacterized protein n=1 Tax=Anaerosacchariphilus polymeriproducens TaxID=1812858 RepID=A0A371ARZ6_9FIRM|nr:hypothetical protein [Anaerosacchariphilus polymeriproducens]RDU22312.1 hypothetical protein DWV06_13520 [Anaerosacchariphilus polymeriproducens]
MEGLIYCSQTLAKNPYYIQNISMNIYSIEELCYYLCNNLYLIDQNIKSEMLCQWIENEIGMKKLAAKLRQLVFGYGTDSMFVGYILRSIQYCEEEKIKEIEEILEQLNNKSEHEKRKIRADRLFQNGKYIKALIEYRKILDEPKERNTPKELYGKIYHNIGTVYGKMFLYQEAMESFKKANEVLNDEESNYAMNWCLYYLEMQGNTVIEEEDESKNDKIKQLIRQKRQELMMELRSTQEYLQLENLKSLKTQGRVNQYQEAVINILEQWKNEYRKNTD